MTDRNLTRFQFISYALAEPATNVLLKRMTPRVFFTLIIITWGICMTLMGTVTNYAGLLAARFFLGLTEAGLYPGNVSIVLIEVLRVLLTFDQAPTTTSPAGTRGVSSACELQSFSPWLLLPGLSGVYSLLQSL